MAVQHSVVYFLKDMTLAVSFLLATDIGEVLYCMSGLCYSSQYICLNAEHFDPFFRDYVRSELDSGYEGPVYLEPLSMNRFTTALIGTVLHLNAWRHVRTMMCVCVRL